VKSFNKKTTLLFMKKLSALILIVFFSLASNLHAEISKEKQQEIEKLLRLTGGEKMVKQRMSQIISAFKEKLPELPPDFWNKFERKADFHGLIEKLIPIYDKYYSIEDLKAVNAFYETPVGQKVLLTLPQVMQESMQIGMEWGEKLGKQVAEEAEQEKAKKAK
jgi:hypothetical protein